MPVKRISDINISQRGLFTAIFGNHDDFFVDNDLKKYNMWQQLYLYLKKEGYDIVLFYDVNNNFHSYCKTDLKKFLNLSSKIKNEESVNIRKAYRASHIKSPLKEIHSEHISSKTQATEDNNDDDQIIYDSTLHKDTGFYKLRGLAEVYMHVVRILNDSTKKSVIIIKSPGQSSFQNQINYTTLFRNINDNYERLALRNRIIIVYDCNDANALVFHFQAYHEMLFSSPYFCNLFISNSNIPIKINTETTYFLGKPDLNEIRNIINNIRLIRNLPTEFTNIDLISSALNRRKWTTKIIAGNLDRASLQKISSDELIEKEVIIPPNIVVNEEILTTNLNKVVGQSEVTSVILKRIKGHFNKPHRAKPINFLLVGTSGVGKTYTAKLLAQSLKNSGYRYIPLMMNEFQQEQDNYKLIGSPPGFVGSETPPRLFSELEKSNRLVILFDEIEKAHEKVILTLMQLLDEGKLSWNEKEGDFSDCIIIFTSNAQKEEVVKERKKHLENFHGKPIDALLEASYQDKLRDILLQSRGGKQFPQEICGRINTLLVYTPLVLPDIIKVSYEHIKESAFEQCAVKVNAIDYQLLGKYAFDYNGSLYGLRGLRERVQDLVSALTGEIQINSKSIYNIKFNENDHNYFLETQLSDDYLNHQELNELFESANKYARQLVKNSKILDKEKIYTALAYVKGQSDSIIPIIDSLTIWFKNREKPLNFFLVGPTGVGKTETAKQLENALSDKGYVMHRIDCNKLNDASRINEIIGSPTGYEGSSNEPELFRKHRLYNKLIILFDEIEKAHPTVLTTIMNLMDEGRLNWNNDERDFRDSILLFTSNLVQTDFIEAKQLLINNGDSPNDLSFQSAIKSILISALHNKGLGPEIVGRINKVLVYNLPNPTMLKEVAFETICKIVKKKNCILVQFDETILEILANIFDKSVTGLRPMMEFLKEDLERAFTEITEPDQDEESLHISISNIAAKGKVKFKIELADKSDVVVEHEIINSQIPQLDNNYAIRIQTVENKKYSKSNTEEIKEKGSTENALALAIENLLYDFCIIDTNIWMETKRTKLFHGRISTIKSIYKIAGKKLVAHGATYEELTKFANSETTSNRTTAAQQALSMLKKIHKEKIIIIPGLKATHDRDAYADKDIYEFATDEYKLGKSILFITNDNDCNIRVTSALEGLKHQNSNLPKFDVVDMEQISALIDFIYEKKFKSTKPQYAK